jgi:hypothetical protein
MRHTATILGWTLALVIPASVGCAHLDLERRFSEPPATAKPHTWWHWMNGNVSRPGITADLEAMQEIGLGGAQIFNVSEGIPPGPIAVMSPEFRDLVKHAVSEAARLGLEICMHNCAGWSSSGGPWVTPDHAMQTLVTSETHVRGPERCVTSLPQPEARAGFYRDIAVLAFPSPRDDARRIPTPLTAVRHERPGSEYFDSFLHEFHRRLAVDTAPQPGFWERALATLRIQNVPTLRYGFAHAFGVIIACGMVLRGLMTTDLASDVAQADPHNFGTLHLQAANALPAPHSQPRRIAATLPRSVEPALTASGALSIPVTTYDEPSTPRYVLDHIKLSPLSYEVASIHF